jgi:hypothetical protein
MPSLRSQRWQSLAVPCEIATLAGMVHPLDVSGGGPQIYPQCCILGRVVLDPEGWIDARPDAARDATL